jgi:hypothetical protein
MYVKNKKREVIETLLILDTTLEMLISTVRCDEYELVKKIFFSKISLMNFVMSSFSNLVILRLIKKNVGFLYGTVRTTRRIFSIHHLV